MFQLVCNETKECKDCEHHRTYASEYTWANSLGESGREGFEDSGCRLGYAKLSNESYVPLRFTVNKEDNEKIEDWKKNHQCSRRKKQENYKEETGFSCPCTGWSNYKYIFTPTSVGSTLEVKCECGATLKDLSGDL